MGLQTPARNGAGFELAGAAMKMPAHTPGLTSHVSNDIPLEDSPP